MVSELKTGFTSALQELSQIQHGDAYLREELQENRRSCQKKALRLEALVESLRVRPQVGFTGERISWEKFGCTSFASCRPAGRTGRHAVSDPAAVQQKGDASAGRKELRIQTQRKVKSKHVYNTQLYT